MSVLSDGAICERLMTGNLGISPLDIRRVQPCSIDLTLGDRLLALPYSITVDPEVDQSEQWYEIPKRVDGRWFVNGMRLYLSATAERVRIPDDCLGLLSGVSTLARQGLQIHATAGFVDPGFCGRLTLELVLFGQAIYLTPGMRIAQIALWHLDRPAEHPYSGRYQRAETVEPAKPAQEDGWR